MKLMKLKATVAVIAIAAGSAAPAVAQQTVTDGGIANEAPAAQPAFTSLAQMTVDDVIGAIVYGPEGSRIGEIDYVIETPEGASGVIGIGGFIGLGEYTVAIPLEDFDLGAEGYSLTLNTDKETLKAQPEIDESGLESLPGDMLVAELVPSLGNTGTAEADLPAADAGEEVAEVPEETEQTTAVATSAVEEAAENAGDEVAGAADEAGEMAEEAGENVADLGNDAEQAVEETGEEVADAANEAEEAVEGAAEDAGEMVADAANEVEQTVESAAEETGEVVAEGANEAEQAAEDTGEVIADAANEAEQAVEEAAEAASEAVADAANEAEQAVEGATDEAGEMVADGANEADPAVETPPATEMPGAVAEAPEFDSLQEMTVGDVVGMIAYDPSGNKIGDIDYVVMPASGAKAVIGIGGFIGLGEYTVALPLDEFKLSDDGSFFTLSTDKETLKEQPEFDESDAAGLPDETPMSDVLAARDKASINN